MLVAWDGAFTLSFGHCLLDSKPVAGEIIFLNDSLISFR